MSKAAFPLRLTGGLAAMAVVALAGCGDPITANHDWYALASMSISVDNVAPGVSTITRILDGRLLDGAHGAEVPGTLIHEICVTYIKGGRTLPSNCRIFLDPGTKDYAAVNPSTDPTRPTMLTDSPPDGRLEVTPIATQGKAVELRISALTGLG